jgi:hypothetical protein
MASVFWDKDGILLVDYLKKGATITTSYYTFLLDKVKQQWSPNGGRNCHKSVVYPGLCFLTHGCNHTEEVG